MAVYYEPNRREYESFPTGAVTPDFFLPFFQTVGNTIYSGASTYKF